MNKGMRLYLLRREAVRRYSSHRSAMSGVAGLSLLHETALLRYMRCLSASGTLMDVVSVFVLTSCRLVPIVAYVLAGVVKDASVFGA